MLDKIQELVHLVRLGVTGDVERVRIQLMRLARALRAEQDPLADVLLKIMTSAESAPSFSPIRGAKRSQPNGIGHAVPVDMDSRLELLRVEDPPQLPHSVVCNPSVEVQLVRVLRERREVTKLKKLGLQPSRTVLFTGPPGVGKTMAARRIAVELGLPLLILDLATVVSSFLGKTGNNLKQAFEFARRQPCVFLLDELDAVAKHRGDDADIGELKRLVTVILQEMDLWPADNLLISATNHAQLLDSAVWRRFDITIAFPRPNVQDLVALRHAIAMDGDPLPAKWYFVLANLMAGTSQSDYVRQVDRLRRAIVIEGRSEGERLLTEIVEDRIAKVEDRAARKSLAVSLVHDAGISQRAASRMTGVARETLRTALGEGKEQ